MVDSAAAIEANRKRSTTVDAPDYEAAFDQLVGRTRRQTLSLFIADLMAIVVSIAVDLSTDTPDMRTAGNLLMSVGCLMSFFGIMFKSIAPK